MNQVPLRIVPFMRTNPMRQEMDDLLSLSDQKAKEVGMLISTALASEAGITEYVAEQANAIKSDIRALTIRWQERYDEVYVAQQ